jgi:hypothetical protein
MLLNTLVAGLTASFYWCLIFQSVRVAAADSLSTDARLRIETAWNDYKVQKQNRYQLHLIITTYLRLVDASYLNCLG